STRRNIASPEDLRRHEAGQRLQIEFLSGLMNLFKADGVRKNEREITFYRWISRKATISRLVQIVLVQTIEMEFRHKKVTAHLAGPRYVGMQLTELRHHHAVHDSSRRTPRMVIVRRLRVVVQRRVLQ